MNAVLIMLTVVDIGTVNCFIHSNEKKKNLINVRYDECMPLTVLYTVKSNLLKK